MLVFRHVRKWYQFLKLKDSSKILTSNLKIFLIEIANKNRHNRHWSFSKMKCVKNNAYLKRRDFVQVIKKERWIHINDNNWALDPKSCEHQLWSFCSKQSCKLRIIVYLFFILYSFEKKHGFWLFFWYVGQ